MCIRDSVGIVLDLPFRSGVPHRARHALGGTGGGPMVGGGIPDTPFRPSLRRFVRHVRRCVGPSDPPQIALEGLRMLRASGARPSTDPIALHGCGLIRFLRPCVSRFRTEGLG